MELQWMLLCQGMVTLVLGVSVLCGNWPIFRGTPVGCVHRFLTLDAHDHFLRLVYIVCGSKGTDAFFALENYCCYTPNPILQIIYLAIVSSTTYIFAKSTIIYIPGSYIGGIHRYTTLLAVGIGLLFFVLTSFSDPGIVRDDNVSQYLSVYPYDNIIYSKKDCSTCQIPKPARSKHCKICDCCVARFDHHCEWMNNCIGERNTGYFMAFLFWHSFLCLYGIVAIGLVLAGRLEEIRAIEVIAVHYGTEDSLHGLALPVAQVLLGYYPTQVLLMVFLAIVLIVLAGFSSYHFYLCLTNTTTNETFKWEEYLRSQKKLSEAKASAAASRENASGTTTKRKQPKSKWKSFFQRSDHEDVDAVVKKNIYNKGFLQNVSEIIFPLSMRRKFRKTKVKTS